MLTEGAGGADADPPAAGVTRPGGTVVPLLAVKDLTVSFHGPTGPLEAVHGLSFELAAGETLGLVGESGSGKSVTGKAILGLLNGPGATVAGRVEIDGTNVLGLSEGELRRLRGPVMSMVFQDVSASLNPVRTVGALLAEPLRAHLQLGRRAARERAAELLAAVGLPAPRERLGAYPHELSGGMRQRVIIALALSCSPRLVIVDEATTSLDVSIQAQILELLRSLAASSDMAMVMISHDLGVIAGLADRMAVMYAGRLVERGGTEELFESPSHPYTVGLLNCIPTARRDRLVAIEGSAPEIGSPEPGCAFAPRCPVADGACAEAVPPLVPLAGERTAGDASSGRRVACHHPGAAVRLREPALAGRAAGRGTGRGTGRAAGRGDGDGDGDGDGEGTAPLLRVEAMSVEFRRNRRARSVPAVAGVSFEVRQGETLGIVGESGSGKSTVARAILQLVPLSGGRVHLAGRDLGTVRGAELRRMRREMQLVMQESDSALNPRLSIGESVAEPLLVHRMAGGRDVVEQALGHLARVGLPRHLATRYPHQLSGGQRQRAIIARALATGPKLVIADEPTSALDVSLRAQIVNLLDDLKAEGNLTYVLISHDLSVVRHACDRVAVMYLGRIVELADAASLVARPLHPYTKALLAAVPVPDPRTERTRKLAAIGGEIPDPADQPPGCCFAPRCPLAVERCRAEPPALEPAGPGHDVACFLAPRRAAAGGQLDVLGSSAATPGGRPPTPSTTAW